MRFTLVGRPEPDRGKVRSVLDKIEAATSDGAKLALDRDPSDPVGSVVPPHALLGGNDVATAQQEVFGPVATIIRARDEADALRIANDAELGLPSAVFTTGHWISVQYTRRGCPV